MRDLLRTPKQFVRERSSHTQRIQKTLEDANIKLDSVITDIVGLSGRRMIEALNRRRDRPRSLGGAGALSHPGHQGRTGGGAARTGNGPSPLHLRIHLNHLDALNTTIADIDKEVDGNLEPFRVAIEMLTTIPGVSIRSRRGPKKAIGAVAASILTAAYHMLKDGTLYQDRRLVFKEVSCRLEHNSLLSHACIGLNFLEIVVFGNFASFICDQRRVVGFQAIQQTLYWIYSIICGSKKSGSWHGFHQKGDGNICLEF
jgi:hypothetical protein